MHAEALRAQRMESIGVLAGGIAHDLNNVLGPILMAVEMLDDKDSSHEWENMLQILRTSSQHGVDLVRQVLSFARGNKDERILLNPAHIVREIQEIIHDTFSKNIQLECYVDPSLWVVFGDPTQIRQVLMNLCVNSRDAMPNGGTLTVNVSNYELDEIYVSVHEGVAAGPFVAIEVTDTGTGISKEIRDKIFDPFFTTKEVGHGTGFGLATSLSIVKSHGGFIDVSSTIGKGTTFKVYLPAVARHNVAPGTGDSNEAMVPRGNGELILVIDDEANYRTVSKSTLERYGYRVQVAAHGAEAVGLYALDSKNVALVLTDMDMPVMDGVATIHALRSINPHVKIVCCSGMESQAGAFKAANAGVLHFINKPYNSLTLLKAVADVIRK
jgi:CheY-like chemotaxis protein